MILRSSVSRALGATTDDAPASDGRWGGEGQVRAQVLVQLLTGQGPELAASVGAVRLRGAAIGGRLNLGGLTLRCPLETASHPACGAHRDAPPPPPGGASRDRPPSRR